MQETLTNETIDSISERLDAFLAHIPDRKEALRVRLSAENVLLQFQGELGRDAPVQLFCKKRLGRLRITLVIGGRSFDPFAGGDETDILMRGVLEQLGKQPFWSYRNGQNTVVFSLDPTAAVPPILIFLTTVLVGIALGSLTRLLSPPFAEMLCEKWLSPIFDTVMGLLETFVIFLIFFLVVSGICSINSVAAFNRIGKRMISRFLLITVLAASAVAVICLLLFPPNRDGSVPFRAEEFCQMLLSAVPTNIPRAFSEGNSIQVIFIAIAIGVMLLVLSEKAPGLVGIMNEATLLFQTLMEYIVQIFPVVVFIATFRLAATGTLGVLLRFFRYPLLFCICCLGLVIIAAASVALHCRVSPLLFLKKVLPVAYKGFVAGSSTAVMSASTELCETKLGVDRQVTRIGIPLGQTFFMVSLACNMVIACLCVADIYEVPVAHSDFVLLVLTASILAAAARPMPGTAVTCFIVVFAQFGIPEETISILIILDSLIDCISTATSLILLPAELVLEAAPLALLDSDTLKRK